jgi:hypothetical protein
VSLGLPVGEKIGDPAHRLERPNGRAHLRESPVSSGASGRTLALGGKEC